MWGGILKKTVQDPPGHQAHGDSAVAGGDCDTGRRRDGARRGSEIIYALKEDMAEFVEELRHSVGSFKFDCL